jgi:hypothetical protein
MLLLLRCSTTESRAEGTLLLYALVLPLLLLLSLLLWLAHATGANKSLLWGTGRSSTWAPA